MKSIEKSKSFCKNSFIVSFTCHQIIKIMWNRRPTRPIRERRVRDFSEIAQPFTGIITNPKTGTFDTGTPFFLYGKWLADTLNKLPISGKGKPCGHIIENQEPSYLMTEKEIKDYEERMIEIAALPYSTARSAEAQRLRKTLFDNAEALAECDKSATQAITLIKESSGSDIHSLMTSAEIGNKLHPLKTLALYSLNAFERYKGKPYDILEQVKSSINDIGFASSIDEVTELQNQIQNVMLEANEMLMKKNPVTNPVTLLAARVAQGRPLFFRLEGRGVPTHWERDS